MSTSTRIEQVEEPHGHGEDVKNMMTVTVMTRYSFEEWDAHEFFRIHLHQDGAGHHHEGSKDQEAQNGYEDDHGPAVTSGVGLSLTVDAHDVFHGGYQAGEGAHRGRRRTPTGAWGGGTGTRWGTGQTGTFLHADGCHQVQASL